MSSAKKNFLPLASKKFLAYLVAELTWKAVIGYMAFYEVRTVTLIAAIAVAGFIEAAYIGSQAILDRYIRLAEIAARRGKRTSEDSDERSDGEDS